MIKKKPKFKLNAAVHFTLEGKYYVGTIFIVNANGTFCEPNVLSYDIYVLNAEHKVSVMLPDGTRKEEIKTGPCVFKHVPEHLVKKANKDDLDLLNYLNQQTI